MAQRNGSNGPRPRARSCRSAAPWLQRCRATLVARGSSARPTASVSTNRQTT